MIGLSAWLRTRAAQNCGATVLPGETLEQAVRRLLLVIVGVIRHAAETARPNETFEQSMNRVLSRAS